MNVILFADNIDTENSFNLTTLKLSLDYFRFKLEVSSSYEDINLDSFDIIFVDQEAFKFSGIDKIVLFKKRFPEKHFFLIKEQVIESETRISLDELDIHTVTKPLIPTNVIRRIKGVILDEQ